MYKEPAKKLVLDLGSIKQNGAADFKLVGKNDNEYLLFTWL